MTAVSVQTSVVGMVQASVAVSAEVSVVVSVQAVPRDD
jgi:hypothetical protein